ncbi:MAG: fibronectin type III domain-containing protein, partial [Gammaproteobacteria bacterium]|nr:fibronectin type III domain-containing protein [Gammaproteobacteria bacterium]
MNPIKRPFARLSLAGRFPSPSTPTPPGDLQRHADSPLVERTPRRFGRRFWHWRAAVSALALTVGLVAGSAAHAGLSATPNPSSNGSYTVSWTAVTGATKYRLHEGSAIVFDGAGRSKAFSGKAAGSYSYTLTYCQHIGFPVGSTICGLPSGFDALTVTVSGTTVTPTPAAPTLTVPASSSTGSYTVSWTKPVGATRFELQEKAGSGAWSNAYSGTASSKAFSGKATGGYAYRARACAGQTKCSAWSATGNIRVTVIAATLSISPNPAPGGNYTVSWTGTGSELLESFNNGATTRTYRVSGTSKAFANRPPGSYAYTLRLCFNLFGANTCVPVSGTATVTVPVPAPTGTISASPSPCVIPAGATRCSTTVTWSTQHATKPCVYLKGSEAKFACGATGSKAAPWITAAGRTLELKNGATYAADTLASVFVKGVPAATPAPTVSASFDASELNLGGSVELTWSSSNAASCSGSRSIGSTKPSGTATFTPSAVGDFSVKVTCTGAGGSGSATATAKVVDVPAAPSAPTVTPSGSTKLDLSWTVPSDNGSAITGYDVQHRLNSADAAWPTTSTAVKVASATLSGLAANTAYQARVRARNGAGTGNWSAPANGRTPPAVPASFTVPASDADGNFRISWNASAGATRYQVQERFSAGAWKDLGEVTGTWQDIAGKHITLPNTAHGYRVRACATACGDWTAAKQVTVSGALAAAPNPSPNGSYRVSWTPSPVAGRYRLLESTDGGTTWSASHTLTATQKAFSDKADGAYVYQVQSCIFIDSLVGWACTPLVSSQLTVTVARSLAPPTLSIAPNPAPGGAYRVSWTASKDATGYVLQERTDGGGWSNVTGIANRSKDFSSRGVAVHGYQVKACDGDGNCGSWSAEATVRVPPATLTVSGACGNGSYELSWTPTAGATKTIVEQRQGTGAWTEAHNGTGSKKALMLTTGASYSFRAKACAGNANCSAWGATLAVTAPDCSRPAVPANLRLDATGADDYRIRWDAVSGSDIRYVLEQKYKSGDWTAEPASTGLSKSYSDQSAGAYRYRLRARSGASQWSGHTAELQVTVPIPPPAPANLRATAPNANRDYGVSWNAVSWGGASATYRLEETLGTQTAEEPVSGTSKAFASKSPGTYSYRVKACAPANNCGGFGTAQSVTVRPDAPGAPTLACDGTDHSLSWPSVPGATSYRLQQREGQGNWTSPYSGKSNSTRLALTIGSEYGFQVKACAGSGNCGAWSATATATAPNCATPGVPGGLAITPSGPDSYKVAWNAASGTAHTYQLRERIGAGSWRNAHSGASREKTFTGKSDGTYAYQVRACPQSGECSGHSAAQSIIVPVPPPVPSGLGATAPDSNGGYTVSWNSMTWGGAVTYTLEERPGGGAWAEVHDGTATSLNVAGKADGSYAYRVRACKGAACGGWSSPLTVSVTAVKAAAVETPPAPYAAKPSLVTKAETDATDATGTIAGAFRVTESGAASYRIPIYATPGTAGTAPELALAYNSQAGNGIAGLGWTLEGG